MTQKILSLGTMEAGQQHAFHFEHLITESQFSSYLHQHDKNVLKEPYVHACQP